MVHSGIIDHSHGTLGIQKAGRIVINIFIVRIMITTSIQWTYKVCL